MEKERRRVSNFAMSSCDKSLLIDKLDYVFKELKCAAKVNLAFRFFLKIIGDGLCRYLYAHESNTITERPKLVCKQSDMTNLKNRKQKMGIVDSSRGKRKVSIAVYDKVHLDCISLKNDADFSSTTVNCAF